MTEEDATRLPLLELSQRLYKTATQVAWPSTGRLLGEEAMGIQRAVGRLQWAVFVSNAADNVDPELGVSVRV